MPVRRRGWRGAVGGGADAVSQVGMSLLNRQYQTQAAKELQKSGQQASLFQSLIPKLLSGDYTPQQVAAILGGKPEQFGALYPEEATRLAPIGDEIAKAVSPEAVPSSEGIRRRALTKGVRSSPGMVANTGTEPGDLPSRNMGSVDAPGVASLIGEADVRRKSLTDAEPPTMITGNMGPGGSSVTRPVRRRDVINLGDIPQERTPEQTAGRTYGEAKAASDLGLPQLQGSMSAQTKLAGDLSPAVVRAEANAAGQKTTATQAAELPFVGKRADATNASDAKFAGQKSEASEAGRLKAYFSPQNVGARVNEAVQKAALDLKMAGDKEAQKAFAEASTAGAELVPLIDRMRDLSDKLTNRESGYAARAAGNKQQFQAFMGNDPDAKELQNTIISATRPLAKAMGLREANLSEVEQEMARKGIGISLGMTKEERTRALRNLYDLATINPEMLKRVGPTAGVGERVKVLSDLIGQRRTAEAQALQTYDQDPTGKAPVYLDPITGNWMRILER